MKKMISLVVVLILAMTLMVACGGNTDNGGGDTVNFGKVFGPELDPDIEYETTTVEDIFVDPEWFDKYVALDVELVEICPAGCWFYVADPDDENNITLYVTRLKNSFTVPMEIEGSLARVYGKVTANNRGEILEGHRIELLD